jgi:hypothetical protein
MTGAVALPARFRDGLQLATAARARPHATQRVEYRLRQ